MASLFGCKLIPERYILDRYYQNIEACSHCLDISTSVTKLKAFTTATHLSSCIFQLFIFFKKTNHFILHIKFKHLHDNM